MFFDWDDTIFPSFWITTENIKYDEPFVDENDVNFQKLKELEKSVWIFALVSSVVYNLLHTFRV